MSEISWDAEQRAVLELPVDASGTIIGAPGSGKTALLIERVARLIGGEDAPLDADQVLVLTPSRASATRLRDRLGQRVDAATPGALARSVGSFAFQIVRADVLMRGEQPPELLTGAEQDRILSQVIEGDISDPHIEWPEHLGHTVRRSKAFRSELRVFIDAAIELDVSRDELAQLAGGAWQPIAELTREYGAVLGRLRTNAMGAAELASAARRALADQQALPGIEQIRVVLVDDAQELTFGGVALIEALRARGVAVLAAGDPDIASGAFRGITPDLFGALVRALENVHVLRAQHRSSDEISWLVRRTTQAIGAGGRIDHRQAPGPEPEAWNDVQVVRAQSAGEEHDHIARALRELHLIEGVPWGQMAVIAHDTRQLVALESELASRDVPTRASGVPRPLGSERTVRQILEIVRLALAPASERETDALVEALRTPFGGFDGVALRRLRGGLRHAELAAAGTRPARELLAEGFAFPVLFSSLDTDEGRRAERFATTLHQLHDMASNGQTIHELLWHVWERARLAGNRRLSDVWRRQATSPGPTAGETARSLDGLVALFAAAKRSIERNPRSSADHFIREILDSDVPEDTLSAPEREATVALMTPANALSTQFDVVVIAGLQDGVWPNTRLRGGLLGAWRLADAVRMHREGAPLPEPATLDRRREALYDELRLFVRAISRARQCVIVTAVDDEAAALSPLFGYLPDARELESGDEHPLTLRGLVGRYRRVLTTSHDSDARAEAASQLRVLAENGVPGADPSEWYGVCPVSTEAPLRDLDETYVRVSPSRIDGFETCGLEWAIGSLGGDTVTSASAGLGTLLHAALERVPEGGVDAMRAVVDERWSELDFETPWIAERERRRIDEYVERLDAYLGQVRAQSGHVIASEATFRFGISLADGTIVTGDEATQPGYAVLNGSIDRVEEYPVGAGEHPAARWPKKFVPMHAPDESAGRVVVVDLKSGKSEERVADAKVTTDAQLSAYQIAVEQGLVDGAQPEALAGARLVVVSKTLAKSDYRVAHQQTLLGNDRDEFLTRVTEAARGMAASSFTAAVEDHCQADRFTPICRVHTIGAVSA